MAPPASHGHRSTLHCTAVVKRGIDSSGEDDAAGSHREGRDGRLRGYDVGPNSLKQRNSHGNTGCYSKLAEPGKP